MPCRFRFPDDRIHIDREMIPTRTGEYVAIGGLNCAISSSEMGLDVPSDQFCPTKPKIFGKLELE